MQGGSENKRIKGNPQTGQRIENAIHFAEQQQKRLSPDGTKWTRSRMYRPMRYRITQVSGSFPEWNYTGQLVIGYDSSYDDENQWATDGVDVTIYNRCEWTPADYPFTHGAGMKVTDDKG